MKRLLTLGLIAPLAAAGALSVSSAASAAIFAPIPTINQFNFGVSFDIQNLQYQRVAANPLLPPNPASLINKGSGIVDPSTGLVIGSAPGDSPFVDFLPPVTPLPGGDAPPGGGTAPITISVINSGGIGFTICNSPPAGPTSTTCTPATIRDFKVTGAGIVNPFITVTGAPATVAAGLMYEFSLNRSTIAPSIPGNAVVTFTGPNGGTSAQNNACVVNPGGGGCRAAIDFTALGKLKITGIPADPAFAGQLGKEYDVNYSYSGPLLNVDSTSTSCGLTVGSMCSINFDPATTGAGNIQATVTPEPGSVGALLALGAVGSFGILKRKKLGK